MLRRSYDVDTSSSSSNIIYAFERKQEKNWNFILSDVHLEFYFKFSANIKMNFIALSSLLHSFTTFAFLSLFLLTVNAKTSYSRTLSLSACLYSENVIFSFLRPNRRMRKNISNDSVALSQSFTCKCVLVEKKEKSVCVYLSIPFVHKIESNLKIDANYCMKSVENVIILFYLSLLSMPIT